MLRSDTQKEVNMADLNALVDQLSELTVLEAAELSKMLEEKWGVSAAAAVAAAPAAGGDEGDYERAAQALDESWRHQASLLDFRRVRTGAECRAGSRRGLFRGVRAGGRPATARARRLPVVSECERQSG